MKKNLFLLTFLLGGIYLIAQPEIDTIQPGVKSVKMMICSYDSYGDSTGLILENINEYNLKGQKTRRIKHSYLTSQEPIERFDEPEAVSYYHRRLKNLNLKKPYDTLTYQYNSNGQLIKSTGYFWETQRHIYTYDANGNCLSEKFTRNGKENYRKEWKYDKNGNRISEWESESGGAAEKIKQMTYNEKNQMIMKRRFGGFGDSIIYIYDLNDSLVTIKSYERFEEENKLMQLHDSTFIVRDPNGICVSSYAIHYYIGETHIITEQYDKNGRIIEEIAKIDGVNTRKITYEYNDSLHTTTYKRYGFYRTTSKTGANEKEVPREEIIYFYNNKGLLAETRRMNGNKSVIERTVYQYTYY